MVFVRLLSKIWEATSYLQQKKYTTKKKCKCFRAFLDKDSLTTSLSISDRWQSPEGYGNSETDNGVHGCNSHVLSQNWFSMLR